MERLEEIREEINGMPESWHYKEKIQFLLSLIDQYKKESELTRSYLVTIGNIARRQDNIHLQEINRHVDDILDSLEKAP